MARLRFEGDESDLAAVLSKHLARSINILEYGETAKCTLDKKAIVKYWELFEDCEKLQANVSFKKTTTQLAFAKAMEASSWHTKMTKTEIDDWVQTMTMRLRNLLRHGQQLRLKKPTWFMNSACGKGSTKSPSAAAAGTKGTDHEDGSGDEEDGEEEEGDGDEEKSYEDDEANEAAPEQMCNKKPASKAESSDGSFKHGFDTETRLPWRQKDGKPKEYGEAFQKPGTTNDDCLYAKFKDGSEWEIAGVLVQDSLRPAATGTQTQQAGDENRWYGMKGDNTVSVRGRNDRSRLMAMFWGKSQVCMVKVSLFKTEVEAYNFMVTIATDFIVGNVERQNLYKLRDDMLQAMKNTTNPPTPASEPATAMKRPAGNRVASAMKRPAAATSGASEVKKDGSRDSLFEGLPTANSPGMGFFDSTGVPNMFYT